MCDSYLRMDDITDTEEMGFGPVRVPVMMRKNIADRLAVYILQNSRSAYDEALEKVISMGLEAASSDRDGSTRT